MIHRIGALLVGVILLMSLLKLNQQKEDYDNAEPYYKAMLFTTIFWFSNLLIGASYLIKAEIGEFPEWISLLHLLGGVTTFLVAASGPMMFRLTHYKDADCDE